MFLYIWIYPGVSHMLASWDMIDAAIITYGSLSMILLHVGRSVTYNKHPVLY